MSRCYLAHHGILGQKWGVRRYQNKDGTLTDLGKARFAKELKKEYEKSNNGSFPFKTSDKFNTISDELLLTKDRKDLQKKYNEVFEKWKQYIGSPESIHDDTDSKEYKEMVGEAKSKILKNPKNYIPEDQIQELKDYAQKNGVSIWETKPYYKALEYEIVDGDTGSKYKKIWEKNHKEYIQQSKKANQLYKEMQNISKDYVNSILGDYGKNKLNDEYSVSIQDLVSNYLDNQLFSERISKN